MPNLRTVVVVLLVALPLLVPAADARPPKPVNNLGGVAYPSAQEAMAVALDPGGRFAFVALKPDPTPGCGGSVIGSVVQCKPDVAGYDIDRSTASPSSGATQSRVRPSTGEALAAGIAVTPVDEGAQASSVYAVKAGPGPVFAVFPAGQAAPQAGAEVAVIDQKPVSVAAITKDNSRLAVGGGVTDGYLGVFTCCSSTLSRKWDTNFTNEKVNAIVVAKDANRMAVGTDKALYWWTDMDVDRDSTSTSDKAKIWSVVTASPVRSVDVSESGGVVVAGLANGEVYYFVTSSKQAFDSYFSSRLAGAINAVAVAGDGRSYAAVSANKEFALYDANMTAAGPVAVPRYVTTTTMTPIDVDGSRTGGTWVVGGESSVVAHTPARNAPAWSIATVDEVKGVAVSADGNHVVAGSKTRFYAWQQTSEVVVDQLAKERSARPNEILQYGFRVQNTGSLQDTYTIIVNKPAASWVAEVDRTTQDRTTRVLAPDAFASVNFTLQSPAIEAPGRHMARIDVFSQGLNKVVQREYLNVTLSRVTEIQITSDQGTSLTLNQGETVPYVFKIVNRGNSYSRINVTVDQQPTQGPRWTITYPEQEINISQGQERQFTAEITAPTDTPDGTCDRITIAAVSSGARGASLPVVACVNPEYRLALTADASNVDVKPGDTKVVSIRVENRGNTQDTVRLATSVLPATAANEWRVSVSPDEPFDLVRGAVRTATVSIRPAVANPPDVTITLRATSAGDAPQSVSIGAHFVPASENESPLGTLAPFVALGGAALWAARRRGR